MAESTCRVCESETNLLWPCLCKGTIGMICEECFIKWTEQRDRKHRNQCELCGGQFDVKISMDKISYYEALKLQFKDQPSRRMIMLRIILFLSFFIFTSIAIYGLIALLTTESLTPGQTGSSHSGQPSTVSSTIKCLIIFITLLFTLTLFICWDMIWVVNQFRIKTASKTIVPIQA